MLKLTLDQKKVVDIGEATIHLIESSDNKVRIGIQAPDPVAIMQRKARKGGKRLRKKTLTELMV